MIVLTEVSYDVRASILEDLRYGGPVGFITHAKTFVVSGRKFKEGLPAYSRFLNIRTRNEDVFVVFNRKCAIISKGSKRLQSISLEIPILILDELELKISTKDVSPLYIEDIRDIKMFIEYLLVHRIALAYIIDEVEELIKEISWKY